MAYENISAELSDENVEFLIQKVKEMDERLPFTINLSPEEIRALPKMGDKSIPFVEKALEYSKQYPELAPKFLDVEELRKDLELAKKLKRVLNVLNPLTEKVQDTCYAVGAEAFTEARVLYDSAKGAAKANVPGADAIVAELGKRYKYLTSPAKKGEEKSDQADSTE